ncbi:type II secretion system minor pseudopilin GspK [uncultured Tateyamaria sp.]|uniref:type II secretion system minor pseudopilin GspK n=1 Tax=uncultured Tateyamaria sp. TaxID=455651 RepID=UPI00263A17EC|nr:type II secretion system minor pseudopilin GspK [uncultured Tateyamaria sp.]
MTRPHRSAGFVLVNALVLVAAMAAAAVLLLSRAESGRMRLSAAQEADVLTSGLAAYEAYGRAVLMRDLRSGGLDTLDDAWASDVAEVPLARGVVSGRISDQQGLFNVNWLADPVNVAAREGFNRLLSRLSIPKQVGDDIAAFVSPQGLGSTAGFDAATPPIAPLGGPILMVEQLAAIPALSPETLALLQPHIAALPGDSTVNINTATFDTLAAALPGVSDGRLRTALQSRRKEPFGSVDTFFQELGLAVQPEDPDAPNPGNFSVSSNWFLAEITAQDGDRRATRLVLYRRIGLLNGINVEWRVSRYD